MGALDNVGIPPELQEVFKEHGVVKVIISGGGKQLKFEAEIEKEGK